MRLIEMRSATVTEKGQISIPKSIRKRIKKGSKVAVLAYADRIELRPMSEVQKKFETAVASEKSLAKEWLTQEEDKAWKNL